MDCDICVEQFDNQDRTPLQLACKCSKILCVSCITKRLNSTARCPYCNIRWSIRNFLQQCRGTTPPDMLEKLFDAHRMRVESQEDHSHNNLGPGELRQYYEKSLLEARHRAEEESAGQIEEDMIVAKALSDKYCCEAEEAKSLCGLMEADDAQMAARIAKESEDIANRFRLQGRKGFPKEYKNGIDRFMKKNDRDLTIHHSRTTESSSSSNHSINNTASSLSAAAFPNSEKLIFQKSEGREVIFVIDGIEDEEPSSITYRPLRQSISTDQIVRNTSRPTISQPSSSSSFPSSSSSSSVCRKDITTFLVKRNFATYDSSTDSKGHDRMRNQNSDGANSSYARDFAQRDSHDLVLEVDGIVRHTDTNKSMGGWTSSSSGTNKACKTNETNPFQPQSREINASRIGSIYPTQSQRSNCVGLGSDQRNGRRKESKWITAGHKGGHKDGRSMKNCLHPHNYSAHSQRNSADSAKIICIDDDKNIDKTEVTIVRTSGQRIFGNTWGCAACTFSNTISHSSCAMCDRKRGGERRK